MPLAQRPQQKKFGPYSSKENPTPKIPKKHAIAAYRKEIFFPSGFFYFKMLKINLFDNIFLPVVI